MPNFKLVFQYTQPNKGWTESYYKTATNLAAAAQNSQFFINTLLGMKTGLTTLVKVRVSDVLNNRSSVVVPINQGGPPIAGQTIFGNPDIVGTSAIVSLGSSQFGSSRKVWLRGLNDIDTVRTISAGADTPSANLLQGINNLIQQLSVSGFTVRSLARIGVPPNVYTNILSIQGVVGSGQLTLNYAAGPVFLPGSQIIINQVSQKLVPGLKGIFTVISATGTSVTIGYNPIASGPLLLPKGRFRPVNYNYGAIDPTVSGFSNFGTRATGKNPLGGRGAKRGGRGLRLA